ncbi:MAG: hypothetical protein BWZ10_01683 [candidate division BRC1 bacterium ADurb.BinA364]|nr:MAG: hypothetical protein BWZ10_01683 [candidate division BRC1 bacterium ADurb.BinA364]
MQRQRGDHQPQRLAQREEQVAHRPGDDADGQRRAHAEFFQANAEEEGHDDELGDLRCGHRHRDQFGIQADRLQESRRRNIIELQFGGHNEANEEKDQKVFVLQQFERFDEGIRILGFFLRRRVRQREAEQPEQNRKAAREIEQIAGQRRLRRQAPSRQDESGDNPAHGAEGAQRAEVLFDVLQVMKADRVGQGQRRRIKQRIDHHVFHHRPELGAAGDQD